MVQTSEERARKAALRLLRRREWDAAHLVTVGCKLTPEQGQRFKQLCKEHGTTRYAVLQRFVMDCLRKFG